MTMTRRDAVAAVAVFAELIASARDAGAQTPAAPPRAPIKFDLPNLSMDDWEVTISHVDYPPGRVGSAHRHAGFVLAYVLKGEVMTKVSGQGPAKIYKVGEMFFEPPGSGTRRVRQPEPDRARTAARDDLREEGIDADDSRHGALSTVNVRPEAFTPNGGSASACAELLITASSASEPRRPSAQPCMSSASSVSGDSSVSSKTTPCCCVDSCAQRGMRLSKLS